MKTLPITAIILTKNEQRFVYNCLKSVSFCNEIIIIDDNSTDKTTYIAKKLGAEVFKRDLNGDFASQRNYGLKKARNNWVLFLDADEEVSKPLAYEILNLFSSDTLESGYFLRRVDILWNKKISHGELGTYGKFGNGYLLRLARKDAGNWERKIHEKWIVKGITTKLKSELLHFPHETYDEFLKDVSDRAKIHAIELKKEHKHSNVFKIIVWPIGKFLYNFLFKAGFLDGIQGFVLAMTMSLHSFIAWTYLWILQKE